MYTDRPTVLSITGSDGTGGAGVQADIKTISAMGGSAVTAITSVTVQNSRGIQSVHALPAAVVGGQVRAVMDDAHPQAIKVGLVADAEAMAEIRNYIVGCPRVVVDPGVLSSSGHRLMDDEALGALVHHILPETMLLILRCDEAEMILGQQILTDDDMLAVAQRLVDFGAEWVLLRGGQYAADRLTALLYGPGVERFFSSLNIEGWMRHGVGGALSSAVATRLAFGDDVPTAVRNAHEYIHSQVVYAVVNEGGHQRPADIYNRYLSLIARHHREAHDVAFYADRLSITTRYLSHITRDVVDKTPKQIIDEYLFREAGVLLTCTTLTVQEISQRLGFSSQMQFCRFVRAKGGTTPTELRRRQRAYM